MANVQTEIFRPTGLLQIEESTRADPVSIMEDGFVPNGLLGGHLAQPPSSIPDNPPHSISTTTTSQNGLSNLASAETGVPRCGTIIRHT